MKHIKRDGGLLCKRKITKSIESIRFSKAHLFNDERMCKNCEKQYYKLKEATK